MRLTEACFACVQAVAAQLASLELPDDSFAGFMDAETATFASRMRRLVRSKVEELQTSLPGTDSGRQPLHLYLSLYLQCCQAHGWCMFECIQGLASFACHGHILLGHCKAC